MRIPGKNNHLQEEKREEKNRAGAEFCAVRSCVPFESLRHLTLRADTRATVRPGATVAPPFLSENFKQRSPLKKKTRPLYGSGLPLALLCLPATPAHPTHRGPENFAKNIAKGRLRPLLSENATPAILRDFAHVLRPRSLRFRRSRFFAIFLFFEITNGTKSNRGAPTKKVGLSPTGSSAEARPTVVQGKGKGTGGKKSGGAPRTDLKRRRAKRAALPAYRNQK